MSFTLPSLEFRPTLALFGMPGYLEMVIVLAIIMLLFGNRLPGTMRSLGQSLVQFKKGMKDTDEDGTGNSERIP